VIPAAKPNRLQSIDFVRGLVMVIMLIDHARDYYFNLAFKPEDMANTWPALFFTRWMTHFCAPIFFFLAGVGAFLSLSRGRTTKDLSKFLWTRGLFLVILDLLVINFFFGNLDIHFRVAVTLWALGWSMIALSALVHLPRWVSASFALILILGHNALDKVQLGPDAPFSALWSILHVSGPPIQVTPSFGFFVLYPLIPWLGVMAGGYAFGPVFKMEPEARRSLLLKVSLAITAGFFVVRGINVYGDLHPWAQQTTQMGTIMSFLNVEKYPPSLSYLLMTLGPMFLLLRIVDAWQPSGLAAKVQAFFLVFGQVPMYYYVWHLGLLFVTYIPVGILVFGPDFTKSLGGDGPPPAFPMGLPGVYLAWAILLVVLYPLCARYAKKKRENPKPWMSYL
jgi:uncharacterized membrane protein